MSSAINSISFKETIKKTTANSGFASAGGDEQIISNRNNHQQQFRQTERR